MGLVKWVKGADGRSMEKLLALCGKLALKICDAYYLACDYCKINTLINRSRILDISATMRETNHFEVHETYPIP